MLHRKKSSYLEDKLVKNSKNPVELRKILKPLCLHANKEIKKTFIFIRMIQSSLKPTKMQTFAKNSSPNWATT